MSNMGRPRPVKALFRRLSRSGPANAAIAWSVRNTISIVRWLGLRRAGRWAERVTRLIAPFVPESKLALANIGAAFPEKSVAERKAILADMWTGLGHTAVEYVFLDQLVDFDPEHPGDGRLEVVGIEHFEALRDDGKPGIIFSAHLANWEILAVVAAQFGLPLLSLFRAPRNSRIAQDLMEQREQLMGRLVSSGRGATFEVGASLDRGEHLGILTDQHHGAGPRVPFFGRTVAANPLVARLARHYECPVHGARSIRLPDGRFHVELTPPIVMPRDAEGLIDVQGGTAAVMAVVEGWVREHPEQWLWLHNRWR
jgi:Kdo2-lipid IVA lauroyltransferase/acyltransferase